MNKFFLKDGYIVIEESINVVKDFDIKIEKKFEFSKLWETFVNNFDKTAIFENYSNKKYKIINYRFMQFLSYLLLNLCPLGKEYLECFLIQIKNEYNLEIPSEITISTSEDINSLTTIMNFIYKIKVSQEPLTAENLFSKLF